MEKEEKRRHAHARDVRSRQSSQRDNDLMNDLHHNSWKIERAGRIAAVKRNVGENDDLLNLASLAFSSFSDSTRMAFDKRLIYFARAWPKNGGSRQSASIIIILAPLKTRRAIT